jgi:hypothetical protein
MVSIARHAPERLAEAKAQLILLKSRMAESASATLLQGENGARQARAAALARAGRLRAERPLQLLAGAAGAAFVLGFALRFRRSNHARG